MSANVLVNDSDYKNGVESGQAKFTKDNDTIDVNAKSKLIGLTKEQLEQYRNDPFWRLVRYVFFVLFWLVWIGMFVGAILIVILSPKCKNEAVKQKWSQNVINYQIYTPTFYDSNGDGVGDFAGIAAKLDDLRRIGVRSIHPIPVVAAVKDEFSPAQVLDVLEVDERFGTVEDLKRLIDTAHQKEINVIVDIPLTVSSSNVWAKKTPGAVIGEQNLNTVLLNVDNDQVRLKLFEATQKLLRLGVDGIHLTDYGFAKKAPVKSLDPLIQQIRDAVAVDSLIQQKDLLIIVDSDWKTTTLADKNVLSLTANGDKNVLERLVENIVNGITTKPIWKYADLDSPRLDQQLDLDPILDAHTEETVTLLSLIQVFLPGPISIYYGEEFGLPSIKPSLPSQYPQRGIMRWDSALPNSGFSTVSGKNFFGDISQNAANLTFYDQYKIKESSLQAFKKLADLRNRNWVFQNGVLEFKKDGLHLYSRFVPNQSSELFVLAVNWPVDGKSIPQKLHLDSKFVQNRALTRVEVKATSGNALEHNSRILNLVNDELILKPFQAVVLRIA